MTKLKLLLLLLFLSGAAYAQLPNLSGGVEYVPVDPSGVCNIGDALLEFNYVNGNLWGCTGNWVQITGGGGGGTTYNLNTPPVVALNAVTQTITAKLQQYRSFDDFGCTPNTLAATNNTTCANAINYSAPLGIALTCQGTYQISQPLPIKAELQIFGQGTNTSGNIGGCTFQQTDPTQDVFATQVGGGQFNYDNVVFKDLTLKGGLDAIADLGAAPPLTNGTNLVYMILDHVTFGGQSHANFYINGFAGVQGLLTRNVVWSCSGPTCTNMLMDAGPVPTTSVSALAGWHSIDDVFLGGFHAIYADATSPTGGGWRLDNIRFQGITGQTATILGPQTDIVITGGSTENIGASDNGGGATQAVTTGTTSGTNQSIITVASGTKLLNGQTITIARGAANGTDFTTTITSGGTGAAGSTALGVADAIPAQVTNTEVTNATLDVWFFGPGSVNTNFPVNVTFRDTFVSGWSSNVGDPSNIRYFVNNQSSFFVTFDNLEGNNRPVYDPGGRTISINSGGRIGTDDFMRIPINANGYFPFQRSFDASYNHPAQFFGNPTAQGGYQIVLCGDASFGQNSQCGFGGNYGPFSVGPYAGTKHPWLYTSNTGDTYLTPVGNQSGVFGNLFLGFADGLSLSTGVGTDYGATGSIILRRTTPPTSFYNQGGILYADNGGSGAYHPWWKDSAGNLFDLANPTITFPTIYAYDNTVANAALSNINPLGGSTRLPGGFFRISYYARITTRDGASSSLGPGGFQIQFVPPSGGTLSPILSSTTEAGVIAVPATGNTSNTVGTIMQGTGVFYATTNQFLTFNFGYTSGTPGVMIYEIHVRVENCLTAGCLN